MPVDLLGQYCELWQSVSKPPDVFAFLDQHNGSDSADIVAVLLQDQQYRWKTDRPLKVEDYLARIPDLASDPDIKLQLAVGEFQALQNSDTSPSIDEFTSRFADLGDALKNKLSELLSDESEEVQPENLTETQPWIFDSTIGDQQTGRYRLGRLLGEGAFGRVYLGFDGELQRQVAIKVPRPARFQKPEDAEAYLAEARTVASLDHPNIVPVHDVGRTDDGSIYVVSKFIEGRTLRDWIKEDHRNHDENAKLLATIAQALNHAHERRLIHRDIKPANILLEDSTGTPYVADFGLAITEEDYLRDGGTAGTPAYMSPEQVRGEGHRLDGRSDIFSLGVVFYELLTGKRPFRSSSTNELLHQVVSVDPQHPRELDNTIPAELERICLKALSKRASDRYSTATELADDLLHWQQGPEIEHKELQVVPKGLRSFDAEDADFFLDLLPGPRNRDGLPESIQFWKTRIEETDPELTFSVGLIYGPSGCGKSSLVKAGLLPRLSDDVVSIYVEATPDETETRILHGLRKQFSELPEDLGLVETFTLLRRNEGHKVVLVLDQFEQWLHAHRAEQETELVSALRQCDGGTLQAVVMVRDDFVMAAARFMDSLDIPILQGHNFATVDLFDVDHAEQVLTHFGQAFGKLPAQTGTLTDEEQEFVTTVAWGLAQDGKVVSIRLALFAEMVKGKPWIPATLEEVGGTEGIGINFLEETFSSRTANPKHRLHQQAAREVLKALLPEVASDIKGHMRSHAELLEASGYQNRPSDFNDLLRILDGELRLITPTDPEGFQTESGSEPGSKYYQLTHDYLVSSLRDWLTRKQKETRRGRAELRLAERTALWTAKPENRNLPAWWEYGNIRLLTDKKNWSEPQRKMMARAGRIHGVRWGSALLVALVTGITVQQVVHSSRQRTLRDGTETAVTAMSTAREILVPRAIDDLKEFPREMVLKELREQFETANEVEKLPLAYALAHFDDVRVEFLVSRVERASPDDVDNFVVALSKSTTEAVSALDAAAHAAESDKKWRHKARLAMLALRLGAPALAQEMCRSRPDPIQRTLFIEECSTWHGDLSALARQVADGPFRSEVALAVGSVPVADVLPPEKQAWESVLSNWYTTQPDTLTYSAAGWALRKWKLTLPEIAASKQPDENRNWHVNSVGMTMLKIPAGSFVRKTTRPSRGGGYTVIEQTVTLTRSFLLADREVTRRQFQQFIDDPNYPHTEKPEGWKGLDVKYNPTEQHPAIGVSWYDAVLFCNWLSHQEGLMPCYNRTGEKEAIIYKMRLEKEFTKEYDAWQLIPEASGYRLPTEAEWGCACRAGTVTAFSHSNEESLLDRYAVVASRQTELPGSKLPNGWGFFDVHGNVREWCHDWDGWFGSEAAVSDPLGPAQGTLAMQRVVRGGMFNSHAQLSRSDHRFSVKPDGIRSGGNGIRVARTYP